MKIQAHDAHRSFDYVAMVNRVFDMMVMNDMTEEMLAERLGLSVRVVKKFFSYEAVSLPTMLRLSTWALINLEYFVIQID